ncbi:MAG: aminotransferase class I/II-fold pyridoxal phosphate-dependent enzyme [Coriobacteriales bacterium]|nr:aminotransferase class I/II-fold pyridoxal phosphate-dependent enzyme [Coriobacteriales bacterium]
MPEPESPRESTGFHLRRPVSLKDSRYPGATGAWVAEMEFPLARPIHDVVERNLKANLLAYRDLPARTHILTATAHWLRQSYGWDVPERSLACVGDIIAGYESVMRMLVPPDAPIIVPLPAYPPLLNTARCFGRTVIEIASVQDETGRFVLDYERIDAVLTPYSLFVLTNPFNPTGQSFTREELERLAQLIDRHDALVFSDEVHCPIILNKQVHHIPYATINETAARHTVSAYSASKAFNIAGLKCAQLVFGSPELRETWFRAASFYADGASRLGLLANIAAYTDPACEEWLADTLDVLRANLALVKRRLDNYASYLSYSQNDATYLLWVDARKLPLEGSIAEYLLKDARLAVADGAEYGVPGFFRLNFALDPTRLAEATDRMCHSFDRIIP